MFYIIKTVDGKYYVFKKMTTVAEFTELSYKTIQTNYLEFDKFTLNGIDFYKGELVNGKNKRKNHNFDVINHLRTL
jgi:hypothetical protein